MKITISMKMMKEKMIKMMKMIVKMNMRVKNNRDKSI